MLTERLINRPWGTFEILYEDANCKVKKIVVNPKSRLSLQCHQYRDETWTIVQGKGLADHYGFQIPLRYGNVHFVKRNEKHRIANNTDEPLIFIEVQTGEKLDEADIIRFEDDYNRSSIV